MQEGFYMKITFCGHSEVTDMETVRCWLKNVTQYLIEEGGKVFYLGGYGAFDHMAASVLYEKKKQYPYIKLILVLPYLNKKIDTTWYDATIYPPLESVPRRFAIPKRNQWMIEKADVVVSYVLHSWGGAATTLEYAIRKKKKIISYLKK